MSAETWIGLFALGAASGGRPKRQQVWGHVNGKPVQLELVEVGVDAKGAPQLLRFDAADAWLAMKAAAATEGVDLQLNSAFRSFEQQAALKALYDAGKGAMAAPPGYSDHEGGIAADIETAAGTNQAFFWLTGNALRFGFQRTVSSEPWHWEYHP